MAKVRAAVTSEAEMGKATPSAPRDPADYRELPEPIRLEQTITSQEAFDPPDPTMGRDVETEWLLRNAPG